MPENNDKVEITFLGSKDVKVSSLSNFEISALFSFAGKN